MRNNPDLLDSRIAGKKNLGKHKNQMGTCPNFSLTLWRNERINCTLSDEKHVRTGTSGKRKKLNQTTQAHRTNMNKFIQFLCLRKMQVYLLCDEPSGTKTTWEPKLLKLQRLKKTKNVHANQLNEYTHFSLALQEMKAHQFGVWLSVTKNMWDPEQMKNGTTEN